MSDLGRLDRLVQFINREDFAVLHIRVDKVFYPEDKARAIVTARCGEEGVTFTGRGDYLLALLDRALTEAVGVSRWTEKEATDE